MSNYIRYKKGYKYQLVADYSVWIPITPMYPAGAGALVSPSGYMSINTGGLLSINKGYAWDGPSGPSIDTPDFMRGSLVHDALYQLMREQVLSITRRNEVDILLREMCREDGMSWIRSEVMYWAVHTFAGKAAGKGSIRKTYEAPE